MDLQSTVTLNTGRTMPVIGLGTWELTDDTATMVGAALGLGYRMIDTASDYGTQPAIGEAIRSSGVISDEHMDELDALNEHYSSLGGLAYV